MNTQKTNLSECLTLSNIKNIRMRGRIMTLDCLGHYVHSDISYTTDLCYKMSNGDKKTIMTLQWGMPDDHRDTIPAPVNSGDMASILVNYRSHSQTSPDIAKLLDFLSKQTDQTWSYADLADWRASIFDLPPLCDTKMPTAYEYMINRKNAKTNENLGWLDYSTIKSMFGEYKIDVLAIKPVDDIAF